MSDWEQRLLSLEKLDRSSPELWPEPIPGVTEYAARNALSSSSVPKNIESLQSQFTEDDYKLLNYYSTLSKESLIQELKKLHDQAYKLGLEEAKEMTRGRFLNILSTRKK
ncbi:protein lin-52 homolog [Halyomorpha halys]|uniref:Protein lin-52 homolog n=1 Tax=Nezara viridula TaxID=85310 RepID=A0A9P0GW91_NEZVI|nr:protein lin-52 homolog [Halyomorpha halys]XP_014284974.1 protein lin-52 homolog [Halyomorpha halys]CAH1390164.1 unnamed protein product [Nezara viridula]